MKIESPIMAHLKALEKLYNFCIKHNYQKSLTKPPWSKNHENDPKMDPCAKSDLRSGRRASKPEFSENAHMSYYRSYVETFSPGPLWTEL